MLLWRVFKCFYAAEVIRNIFNLAIHIFPMGREIQECISYHINSHRMFHNRGNLRLRLDCCDNAQKDAQYVLENMLRGERGGNCFHKNPYNWDYCHELTSCGYFNGSFDSTVQSLVWALLSSHDGHREILLDLERNGRICSHAGLAAEIAHDGNSGLTVLTARLYNSF